MSNQQQSPQKSPSMPRSFGPRPGGRFISGQKPKNFKGTVKKLAKRLAPFKVSIIISLIATIGSTIFAIVGPSLAGEATTAIFNGIQAKIAGVGGMDFQLLIRILLTLALLYLASSTLMFLQGYLMSSVVQNIAYTLRKEISEKLDRIPIKAFDTITHGEILSRVTNDIDTLGQTLGQGLIQSLASVATIIGVIVMMLRISWLMTLIALLLLPLSLIIISAIVKRSQKLFVKQQAALGEANALIEEVYGGHDVVKAFNAEPMMEEKLLQINEKLYESAWKSQFFSGLMGPIMHGTGDIGYVAIALLGGVLVINGTITVGNIQAFIQYMRNFSQQIGQTAQVTGMFQSSAAAAERVFEFLDTEEEYDRPDAIALPEIEGCVGFDHVAFSYDKKTPVIKDFSMHVTPGQRIAIVGPTGAGKTTIVKLLMRFYDVDSGSITIDDHDIRTISRNDLRKKMGMVLQDAWLFNGTIRENITYGRLDATDEEVEGAAKAARVDHFIHSLPGGFDMIVNEESSNISQGQKQLITIARAFLANPRILILDEATSSVDTRTEILVKEAMSHLMNGRTSFIIAHRLSTIRDADTILVLNEGDVVEQGTHEQLLESRGFYADLYNAQFETSRQLDM
ncbi:MAG: ABC transporter ATP-binding protein [Sphaerochaetaceae bacterium]|nr:ABC transporter ATP-binding protein [Sphaerochaetaceae bacterium]